MANVLLRNDESAEEKIKVMQEDARFEVADPACEDLMPPSPDFSAVNAIRSKKSPPRVPKLFLSNDCIFNCSYCCCRNSYDKRRYCNNPTELARIAVAEAMNNRHGVFVTSAIHKNPDYTEELIIETIKKMRTEFHYNGYIHAKIMPGTDPLLIEQAGKYADRLSVNIEVAKSEGYSKIAKQKNKVNILTPMQQISDLIRAEKAEKSFYRPKFATSQTTQLMAGSTEEDDRTIMILSKALYQKYRLSRVYYTAFQYQYPAVGYELPLVSTPAWRVRRLYQADRLIQLYGFSPDDVTPEQQPNLSLNLDPKTNWALRNLHRFPVEINTADFESLIRVPGIGLTYARKIIRARRECNLTHDILKQMHISLKRAVYFITCGGKFSGGCLLDNPYLLEQSMNQTEYSDICEQLTFSMGEPSAFECR